MSNLEKDRELFARAIREAWDRKIDAKLADAEPAIDPQTGVELRPGDPDHCKGNGKHDGVECCCDGCDHYLACYPDAMPKEE